MGRASVPTPALYPAFFFVLEKALKSAGNAVISTLLMHRSYGLQGSLKRRYKHPFPASINEYYTAKNGLGTIAPRLLSRVKVGTHSALFKGSHTAAYTPKQGPSGRGRYHYPRSVPHVHKHPRAGYQNGVLCRFGILAGRCSRRTQRACGAAMRLCASLFRGVAAPLGCVIFSVSVEIAACMPCAQGLSVCARRGVVSLPSARFTCC